MKNIFKNKLDIFRYAFIQLLSKSLVLISTYMIAIKSSNEIFGYITIFQASMVFALTIFGFNIQSGIIRFYFNVSTNEILNRIKFLIIILFLLSLISSFILFFIYIENNYLIWFSLLPIIGFLNGMLLAVSMVSRANKKYFIYALSELVRPFFLIILAILFWFNQKFNIVMYYSIIVLMAFIVSFLYSALNFDKLVIVLENKEKFDLKIFIKYTLPLFFVQIMSLVNNVSDKYILNYFMTISVVGLYGKAYLIGSSFGFFLDSLMLLWMPYVMKNKSYLIHKGYCKIVKLCFIFVSIGLLLFLICLALLLTGYNNNTLGVSFNFLILVLVILSAFISRIPYQILTPLLSAYDKTKDIAKISLISMVLGVIINVLLIPNIGVIGAAVSTFFSFFCYSVLSIHLIKQLKNESKFFNDDL